ncbi:hypothetical protein GCM10022224_023410 [Nonomuraea antimicrobica]|uniref:Uncharacterized protein n=1 Tax=Nonomuraea antimicrobica TaxID=561173 RepID=A0ABP7BI82_9ACTN
MAVPGCRTVIADTARAAETVAQRRMLLYCMGTFTCVRLLAAAFDHQQVTAGGPLIARKVKIGRSRSMTAKAD